MASLAPGNGWFPHRSPNSTLGAPSARNGKVARRQSIRERRNASEVPPVGNPVITHAATGAVGGTISTKPDSPVSDPVNASRPATWAMAWGVLAAVVALLIWVGFMGAYVGGAVALGIPWTIVAVAMAAIHVLAAILIVLLCVRIGRNLLLSAAKRNQSNANAVA